MRSLILALVLAASSMLASGGANAQNTDTAIFAGGCFWCVESDFDKVDGVLDTVSGYAGGTIENPTYNNHPDYIEAVKLTYDPSVVSYDELLTAYWHSVDPTDPGGQFCDRGHSYISTVFVNDAKQRKAAEASKKAVADDLAIDAEIVTPIVDTTTFYPAEAYHQNYYQSEDYILSRFGWVMKKDAYKGYREGCGRDLRVEHVWGDTAFEGIHH